MGFTSFVDGGVGVCPLFDADGLDTLRDTMLITARQKDEREFRLPIRVEEVSSGPVIVPNIAHLADEERRLRP